MRRLDQETRNAIEVQLHIYDTYRRYIIHQDNVINYRMTWLLTIHGFLYATYGFTLQKKVEIIEKISSRQFASDHMIYNFFGNDRMEAISPLRDGRLVRTLIQLNWFLGTIVFVGSSISAIALILVIAASRSSKNLIKVGDNSLSVMTGVDPRSIHENDGLLLFPIYQRFNLTSLTGGGSQKVPRIGRGFQYLIPLILIFSWVISGVVFLGYSRL